MNISSYQQQAEAKTDAFAFQIHRLETEVVQLLVAFTDNGKLITDGYYLRWVSPMRNLSTPRAALRPSVMAQTTSDWPRRMSPAAKTPGIEDM